MTSTSDPLVGHVLDGRYQLIDRVARGGMATVYRANDTRLDRLVAVKVMHAGLGDDADFARKFDREARSAARLSHPNVVSVFDQGNGLDPNGSDQRGGGGRPYIVMELVDGRTLRSIISREAPLAPIRALSMIEPVLAALAAAHDAGLVHRDIKPENVLISGRGQIKVGDFGLARAVTAQTSTATAGLLIGTVSYLPPELVTSGKADARSDVYSTGVVLFEMLTGRKPHTGETPIQVAYAHVHKDVPPPSSLPTAGPIPDYLDALIARATARNPDARPHDARVMLAQVRRVKSALQAGLREDPELSQDLTVPLSALRENSAVEENAARGWSPVEDAGTDPFAATAAIAPQIAAAITEDGTGSAAPAEAYARPAGFQPYPAPNTQYAGQPTEEQEYTPTDIRFLSRPSTPTRHTETDLTPVASADQLPAKPIPPHRPVHRSRHRVRGWVALLLVLLLTTIAVAAGWYYAKGRFTSAPALTSMSKQRAQRIAAESGFQINLSQSYSETVPKGNVINTRPGPGGKILRGGDIAAVVSRGPERFTMPKVAGLSQKTAESVLEKGKLAVGGVSRRYSETVTRGKVLSSSSDPGDRLKSGSEINLVISAGPKPIKINNYAGQNADQAVAALQDAGFKVRMTSRHSTKVDQGAVISQSPGDGTGHKGDQIELVESLGPVLVSVPQVRSMGVEAAKKTLEQKGFKVQTTNSKVLNLGLGYVASSDPGAGSKAAKGSTITLTLV